MFRFRAHDARALAAAARFLTLLAAAALALPGCGEAADQAALVEWLVQTDAVEVGTIVDGASQGPAGDSQLRAAGFMHLSHDQWERRATLSATPELEPLPTDAYANIGAVSVLSIHRRNGEVPYLYATLRSLFAELPPNAVVNVFVGNNDQGYVAPWVLAAAIGVDEALRVNVVATEDAAVEFMKESVFSLSERASWNYARMLRAYGGPSYHLTFEDDVQIARGSIATLDVLLGQNAPSTVSMYNVKCGKSPGSHGRAAGSPYIAGYRRSKNRSSFWGTQGVAYRGHTGLHVGQYIQTHLGEKPFDLLVDRYLKTNRRRLGYVQPSMVQHMGIVTTGLGYHHTSGCFEATFPPLAGP